MVELVLLDQGDFGHVLMDADASYVRTWALGDVADPRLLHQLEVTVAAILGNHLHYVITDLTGVTGRPSMDFLAFMTSQLPVMARAGCRRQFTVLSTDRCGVTNCNVRTYHRIEGEHGIQAVEVPTLQDALDRITALNLSRSQDLAG